MWFEAEKENIFPCDPAARSAVINLATHTTNFSAHRPEFLILSH